VGHQHYMFDNDLPHYSHLTERLQAKGSIDKDRPRRQASRVKERDYIIEASKTLDIEGGFIPYKAYPGIRDAKKGGTHRRCVLSSSCYQSNRP